DGYRGEDAELGAVEVELLGDRYADLAEHRPHHEAHGEGEGVGYQHRGLLEAFRGHKTLRVCRVKGWFQDMPGSDYCLDRYQKSRPIMVKDRLFITPSERLQGFFT
ncbi:hypothetical protein AM506_21770, partial [Rossellomorea vietnamensis]